MTNASTETPEKRVKDAVVAVRLDAVDHAGLVALAEAEKVSLGVIIRRALSRELRRDRVRRP